MANIYVTQGQSYNAAAQATGYASAEAARNAGATFTDWTQGSTTTPTTGTSTNNSTSSGSTSSGTSTSGTSSTSSTYKSPVQTSVYSVKGYDTNNGGAVVWVKPGVYVPGVSATAPTTNPTPTPTPTTTTSTTPANTTGLTAAEIARGYVAIPAPSLISNYQANNTISRNGTLYGIPLTPTTQPVVDPSIDNPPTPVITPPDNPDPEKQAMLNKLYAEIDATNYSGEQKAILKNIAYGDYVSGQIIPTQADMVKIIQDAATNATTDLTPYYNKLTTQELEDVKRGLGNIRDDAARYAVQEAKSYGEKLAETKQSLRARGLTFAGTSVKTLGNESANTNPTGMEGSIPMQRRLDYADKVANWQQTAAESGIKAERDLGSSAISGVDFGKLATPYGDADVYKPQGNVSIGDVDLQKKKAIEESKWNRVSAYKLYI